MSADFKEAPPLCDHCGGPILELNQQCPALDDGGVFAMRLCPNCGDRLTTETAPGSAIPRRACASCNGGDHR